jgi:diguanylate cyclase (GGDEF)-like protein
MNQPSRRVRGAARVASLVLPCILLLSGIARADSAPSMPDPRNLLFTRISIESGLSQATVNAIEQDREGFIWVGTQEGLNRFDGQEFRVYSYEFDQPDSLSSDWVWDIYLDSRGSLWVGTEGGGLNRYNRAGDSFTHFRHDADNPRSLSSDRVRAIYEDSLGVFWVGTDGGGLNRLDPDTGEFEHFRHEPERPDSLPHDTVLDILEDRAGNLWLGTNGGGLSRFDRNSGSFTNFQHDPNVASSISNDMVRAIFEDREGRLWVATYEGGVNIFDAASGGFRHFKHDPDHPNSLSNNRVRNIYQDHQGTLWVATDAGLNEWRPVEQGFVSYKNDSQDISSISDDRVTSVFQDRGGVLWVGTYYGVNKWNYLSDAFTYFQNENTAIKLSSNVVTAIDESKNGEYWVGTYGGGLNRIDIANSTVSYYRSLDGKTAGDANSGVGGPGDDRIMAVHVDDREQVWVGTRANGLSMFDPRTRAFTHYRHEPGNPESLSRNNVTSIFSDANRHIWVGTYGGGLNRLDTTTGTFTVFRHDPEDDTSIASDRVLAIYRDRGGKLWVGTEDGGLNRFDTGRQTFLRYRHEPGDAGSLSNDSAWAINEGSDGSLWVGTNGGGLNRWKPADRAAGHAVFQKYRKRDGLRSNTIQAILEDAAGTLWLSSNRGLDQLDPDTGTVRHFSRSTGLRDNDFNFGAALRTRSNRLLFGGTAGIVAFHPNEILTNRHQPDIVLTASGRDGPLDTRYSIEDDSTELELGHQDDMISFVFSGLDYSAPERNQYRYMLEGFDRDWIYQMQFRQATYTSLPHGSYRFIVQAANNSGIWNRKGVSIPIEVTPPPWLTYWAYAIYLAVALAIVASYMRVQSAKLARETKQRQELERQVEHRTLELAGRNEELLSLNDQLKEASWRDALTGLRNRRFLDEIIEGEVAQAYRQTQDMKLNEETVGALDIAPALSFMMIDLDGFKAINDTHGHQAGDEALLQVCDILRRCCRKSDTIIRWGGDEFLIISRNTSNRSAEKLAERLRSDIADHQYEISSGHVAALSASIGFAVYPFLPLKPDEVTWEQVSGIADQCAYVAKQNGRNAWLGIYGNRNITPEDLQLMKTDIGAVIAKGNVGVRTSVYGELKLSEQAMEDAQ